MLRVSDIESSVLLLTFLLV